MIHNNFLYKFITRDSKKIDRVETNSFSFSLFMVLQKLKMGQLMLVVIMRLTLMQIHRISETLLPSTTHQVKNMILL